MNLFKRKCDTCGKDVELEMGCEIAFESDTETSASLECPMCGTSYTFKYRYYDYETYEV